MSAKTPIRTVFNDSNVATGLAEFQTGEFVPLSHGGIGAACVRGVHARGVVRAWAAHALVHVHVAVTAQLAIRAALTHRTLPRVLRQCLVATHAVGEASRWQSEPLA